MLRGSTSSAYEIAAFPNGSHDDQIDSLSQFLQVGAASGVSRGRECTRFLGGRFGRSDNGFQREDGSIFAGFVTLSNNRHERSR